VAMFMKVFRMQGSDLIRILDLHGTNGIMI